LLDALIAQQQAKAPSFYGIQAEPDMTPQILAEFARQKRSNDRYEMLAGLGTNDQIVQGNALAGQNLGFAIEDIVGGLAGRFGPKPAAPPPDPMREAIGQARGVYQQALAQTNNPTQATAIALSTMARAGVPGAQEKLVELQRQFLEQQNIQSQIADRDRMDGGRVFEDVSIGDDLFQKYAIDPNDPEKKIPVGSPFRKQAGVQVNVGGTNGLDAFTTQQAKNLSDRFAEMQTAGAAARVSSRKLANALKAVEALPAQYQGFAGEGFDKVRKLIAQATGLDVGTADSATLINVALEQQAKIARAFAPVSNSDMIAIRTALPGLGQSKQANRTLIAALQAQAEFESDLAKAADEYVKKSLSQGRSPVAADENGETFDQYLSRMTGEKSYLPEWAKKEMEALQGGANGTAAPDTSVQDFLKRKGL
jgi:hypothetical protein